MESKLSGMWSPAPLLALMLVCTPLQADQIQDDFDTALQAIDQNQLRTARERLTNLLTTNPSLSRARLELARVYYLSQDYTKAREEAQRVAAEDRRALCLRQMPCVDKVLNVPHPLGVGREPDQHRPVRREHQPLRPEDAERLVG